MKTFIMGILLLSLGNIMWAQQSTDLSPEATKKAQQKKYFFAGVEATKSAVEYQSTDNAYLKKRRYPKALECYVRSAEYYALSEKGGKFGSSATKAKKATIKEADKLFEICDAKGYEYSISLKERIEKLKRTPKTPPQDVVQDKDKVPKKQDKKSEEQTTKTFPNGRKLYLDGKVGVFSVVTPEGFEVFAPDKMYKMPNKTSQGVYGMSSNIFSSMGLLATRKFRVSKPYFEAQLEVLKDDSQMGKKKAQDFTRMGDKDKYSYDYRQVTRNYGRYKGQMMIHNRQSLGSVERYSLNLRHRVRLDNGVSAYFYVKVKQVYNKDDYNKVMQLFMSFQLADGTDDKPCKTLDEKLLYDKAIKVSYYLMDPYRKPFVLQKPVLERDKVPAAWAEVSKAIITAIKRKKTALKAISTIANIQNKQYVVAAFKQLGWAENALGVNILGVEFFPAELDGAPTGNVSNVVTFYLNALRGSAEGISKLEERLNNMALDLYWEVPYIGVEGICIPRMKCKNGKMVPDYSGYVFEEKKRVRGKFTGNKKFLTLTQLQKELETNYDKTLSQLISEKNYTDRKDKCYKCDVSIYDIVFPGEETPCAYNKNLVLTLTDRIEEEHASIKLHKKLLQEWKSKRGKIQSELDAQIKTQEKLIKYNADTISSLGKQISTQKQLLVDYEKNLNNAKTTTGYKNAEAKIATYTAEIERLKKLNEQLRADILYNDGLITKIKNRERETMLQSEITASEKRIDKMTADKKEAMRLRNKHCKGEK